MQVRPDRQEGYGRSSRRCSLPGRNEQTEGFHDTADLVGKLGSDSDQPRACPDKRAGQHAVKSLHAHLTKEPDFCELRQTIGVIRVRLVRRHIERRFSMARIDADRRQPLSAQRIDQRILIVVRSRTPPVSRMVPACGSGQLSVLGSDAHLPRQIRLPPRRIDTTVSFIDTVETDIVVHGCSPFDAWARLPVVSPYFHVIGEQPPASMSVTGFGATRSRDYPMWTAPPPARERHGSGRC